MGFPLESNPGNILALAARPRERIHGLQGALIFISVAEEKKAALDSEPAVHLPERFHARVGAVAIGASDRPTGLSGNVQQIAVNFVLGGIPARQQSSGQALGTLVVAKP
jgi:hypothetical protein